MVQGFNGSVIDINRKQLLIDISTNEKFNINLSDAIHKGEKYSFAIYTQHTQPSLEYWKWYHTLYLPHVKELLESICIYLDTKQLKQYIRLIYSKETSLIELKDGSKIFIPLLLEEKEVFPRTTAELNRVIAAFNLHLTNDLLLDINEKKLNYDYYAINKKHR